MKNFSAGKFFKQPFLKNFEALSSSGQGYETLDLVAQVRILAGLFQNAPGI